jgi:hypothetical protein
MKKAASTANCRVLERELAWLQTVIEQRFAGRQHENDPPLEALAKPPGLSKASGPFAHLLRDYALDAKERLIVILALAPHLAPESLDPFLLQNQVTGRRFSEFGGLPGQSHSGFLPTVETAWFLIAGGNRLKRLQMYGLLDAGHRLISDRILEIHQAHPDEPAASAALRVSRRYIEILFEIEHDSVPSGAYFPAERIATEQTWDDLVLDRGTRDQIDMIGGWIQYASTLLSDWGLAGRVKPGYRCLFHGGPGTGKTMTACLLGKQYGLPVYRVDLSQIVSKWIGETEKNLAALFDTAHQHNWILFFDEAEALFGRRTEAHTATDRSANQQIAYLLQRLEDFPGIVILSTNQRGHMDEAFARRFQSTIHFPMPDAAARLALWERMFRNGQIALSPTLDFKPLAAQHPMAGGAIINVLRYACLRAAMRSPQVVELADIAGGIKIEMQKEGHYIRR